MRKIIITLLIGMLLLSFVSADVIMPTVTYVYFEQNGHPYNEKIEFTVKCYGYGTGMPGDANYNPNKEPGTYTPEEVFSFSASYSKYGTRIYENYYTIYRHIDYCNLEGKTKGKKFVIENYADYPVKECKIGFQYQKAHGDIQGTNYYRKTERYTACIQEIENYTATYGFASEELAGATREDWNGEVWAKQENSMWSNPNYPETQRGNILVDMYPGGTAYAKYMRDEKICDRHLVEVPESELEKDPDGNILEQKCELRFNLDEAEWGSLPEPKSFWEAIACFFKKLFGRSC